MLNIFFDLLLFLFKGCFGGKKVYLYKVPSLSYGTRNIYAANKTWQTLFLDLLQCREKNRLKMKYKLVLCLFVAAECKHLTINCPIQFSLSLSSCCCCFRGQSKNKPTLLLTCVFFFFFSLKNLLSTSWVLKKSEIYIQDLSKGCYNKGHLYGMNNFLDSLISLFNI